MNFAVENSVNTINLELSLNFVTGDLQLCLQSVSINKADKTQECSRAMAEGQTGSRRTEGLRDRVQKQTSATFSGYKV